MPTKEERDQRNAQERARYAALSPEERQAELERHNAWRAARAEDPEASAHARALDAENRRVRYQSDPEYREKIKKAARERAAARRAALKKKVTA